MARCAFFTTDLFAGAVIAHSGENPDLPASNVARPLPGEVYEQAEAQGGGASSWEVSSATGYIIRIDELLGGGTIATTIPTAWHSSTSGLGTAIANALNTSAFLARTDYAVGYSTATRKWTISSASVFMLVNSSAANNLATIVMGYDETDTTTTIHQSNTARSSSITHVRFDVGSAGAAPNLIGVMLESVGGTADNGSGTGHAYASNTNLGRVWADWVASASLSLAVSARPSEAENTLQAAVTSSATPYQFWFFVWSHIDDHTHHRIRILRGCAALSSATRTVREVQDHQLAGRGASLSLESQHPVRLLSDWRITVELERWELADYRAVKVAVDRYGRHDGLFFALNWTDLLSAALTVNGEADKGLIFYGALRSSSEDRYAGASSDYMTGSIGLGQVR